MSITENKCCTSQRITLTTTCINTITIMSYYDEEIIVGGPDAPNLSSIKVERLPSSTTGGILGGLKAPGSRSNRNKDMYLQPREKSADDDGLLQDIIDHGDIGDDDDDDSDIQKPLVIHANQRPQTRPGSTRNANLPTAKALDNDTEPSESESDDATEPQPHGAIANPTSRKEDKTLSITPEKWENLTMNQEVKDILPYILKYTPQSIQTPYHLQPFVPEYVPAVGDVDAFLKVTIPPLLQQQQTHEINEHLRKMGLYFLDEPSGEQSEPSLLNMKLRSVLTGSGVNPRSVSASLIPTAKSVKDIDKWITEVEQVHMTQSTYDTQPRKDIEPLLIDWPRAYAEAATDVQEAYNRCMQDDDILQYIRVLCERFGVESHTHTQTDFILNVQTLFALYLAANQAWE